MTMTMTALEATDPTYPVRMARLRVLRHAAEVEWHIVEGSSLIARQQRIVENLERSGRDASAARDILQTLAVRQALDKHYLEVVLPDLGDAAADGAPTALTCGSA